MDDAFETNLAEIRQATKGLFDMRTSSSGAVDLPSVREQRAGVTEATKWRNAMRRRGPKSQVLFKGFRIVRLHDACTREAIRFFRNGSLIAIIQKNGNIAISASGIFDNESSPKAQAAVARCLGGLKLVSSEFVQAHETRAAIAEKKSDIQFLRNDAERLGFKIALLR